jgi:hypothetical protein
MQPAGPAPNRPAPAQDVPDPAGPAPLPVEVYAGPNGPYTRVGDSGGSLHELVLHNGDVHSFVVLRDTRIYVVDAGADPAAPGRPANPIPVAIHAGQDGRPCVTAWRAGFNVEELFVHTDVTGGAHYVEFDGRRTSILDMAGMPPRQL